MVVKIIRLLSALYALFYGSRPVGKEVIAHAVCENAI